MKVLVIDPAKTTTLYAGTIGEGLFKSTDSGGTWFDVNTGLTSLNILSLAVDPMDSLRLYAGTDGGGISYTRSGGAEWDTLNVTVSLLSVPGLALDPLTVSTLYAGTEARRLFKITEDLSEVPPGSGGGSGCFISTIPR